MNLKKVDKPPGVAVSLPTCECWREHGTVSMLIPVGKGYWYCPACEQWYFDEEWEEEE